MSDKKEYPAIATVHWPSGPVHCCDEHARELLLLGEFMCGHTVTTIAPDGSQCSDCINEAK